MGDAFADAITNLIFFAFVAGAVLATVLIFALPWLWHLLKPLIHTLTS
jgi:hypothetical protein